jgi:phosphoribosyl 1,2-cyclic phosphodiesterase
MGLRFTVLASGSSGNASLVQVEGFGVLIDVGLGPRQLAARLNSNGLSWSHVQAALLTHTHTDHWKEATLGALLRQRISLWCHPGHHTMLRTYSDAFPKLEGAQLVNAYAEGQKILFRPGLSCSALRVRHDGGPTFGFRFEGAANLFGQAPALGYVADLGCWDDALAANLADVDLLAVEFNHDVQMQHASGRTQRLIDRILGDDGHLSNEQAAGLVRAVLDRSEPGRLRHVVQLHLSRDCNRHHLAKSVAETVARNLASPFEVHTASQDVAGKTLQLEEFSAKSRRRSAMRNRPATDGAAAPPSANGWLPGLGEATGDAPPSGGRRNS